MNVRRTAGLLLMAVMVCSGAAASVEGTFQGKVVDPPVKAPRMNGWIYVEGRNHMLRRVEVRHATVVFSDRIPASQQRPCRMDCLAPGQEILVTAEQDQSGEWHAKRIEILSLTVERAWALGPGDEKPAFQVAG